MITNSASLKAKLKNKSKETNIPAETLLKMFMFERFLIKVSNSSYKQNFILKGGFLISSIFGVSLRSTVDIDTTIKEMPLNKDSLTKTLNDIIKPTVDDNCLFELSGVKNIRTEDLYNGFEIILKATMDKIWTFINIDVTTGDYITYKEVNYQYKTILENDIIDIVSYNYETIVSEKFEAIISRGIINTRMKDYYDIYICL